MSIRRVELHQSVDRTVFSQVRELQRGLRILKSEIPKDLDETHAALNVLVKKALQRVNGVEKAMEDSNKHSQDVTDKLWLQLTELENLVKKELFAPEDSSAEEEDEDGGDVVAAMVTAAPETSLPHNATTSALPAPSRRATVIRSSSSPEGSPSSENGRKKSRSSFVNTSGGKFVTNKDFGVIMEDVTAKLSAVELQAADLTKKSRISVAVGKATAFQSKKKLASIARGFTSWLRFIDHLKHERLTGLDAGFNTLTKVVQPLARRNSRQSVARRFHVWAEQAKRMQAGEVLRVRCIAILRYWLEVLNFILELTSAYWRI